ncbi:MULTISPECIES: protease HtpX [Pseudoalteromonas]|jgi:heat shock protein HtpX|uniref:Protease HtpX n=1 Tax=Pseudoalteromonas lipolytica TaxID=570156 RepID=A0AAD0RZC9_9GAMM|nr:MULTISPECIES: protease HtpX [Pseudoalteromonas]AXV65314.1 protease HtpX [Pseudoalteromonas donghaensis]EWH07110.1 heat shock protein HtpX [Pseudoalteromonas lipolytica SCSIO 04301]MAE01360.1 protease HtpX [Pseudoalteromonas sp.]MBE0350875.1 heat shock protein HtpX [Pseudoalteromonas lipolytica LMEB 39]MCC9659715.1 protease HtpX [Pseudoalteromonas sp. MB41]|tara:strand:- start:7879 stop:8739 length:861 start_codon:yes stop_codon:yes gene_type:complete
MKRVFLFLLTNLAVMLVLGIVLSIVMSVLGISHRSLGGILVISTVFGFGGSFISLFMSKWMAKKSTGAHVIEQPRSETEQWLVSTVAAQAKKAGIAMPEVAIYDSPEMNAFATGPSKNNSLVAVSTGLLHNMNQDQAEAVLAHEVSHIANGDMVTLTLIQGVVNTFVIFMAKVLAGIVDNFINSDEEEGGSSWTYFLFDMIFQMLFGVLASVIVAYYSRKREFSADAGAAKLVGADKMRSALERLKQNHPSQLEGSMMAFGIASGKGVAELFSSHPPLDERINALR